MHAREIYLPPLSGCLQLESSDVIPTLPPGFQLLISVCSYLSLRRLKSSSCILFHKLIMVSSLPPPPSTNFPLFFFKHLFEGLISRKEIYPARVPLLREPAGSDCKASGAAFFHCRGLHKREPCPAPPQDKNNAVESAEIQLGLKPQHLVGCG